MATKRHTSSVHMTVRDLVHTRKHKPINLERKTQQEAVCMKQQASQYTVQSKPCLSAPTLRACVLSVQRMCG